MLERADSDVDADADSTLVDAIDERLSLENGSVDDKGSANCTISMQVRQVKLAVYVRYGLLLGSVDRGASGEGEGTIGITAELVAIVD